MSRWTDTEWLAEANAWIRAVVDAAGERIVGDLEQPHVRPWATVLRVPSTAGDLWFKANVPELAYEAGIVEMLADLRPELVPPLVAVDRPRGWMLMRDGGIRLREIVAEERDLGRWFDVLPRYGELQLATGDRADELVALGVPDRRLAVLPDQFQRLLDELEVPDDERARLEEIDVRALCRRLQAFGIPETIQHDDLHDGQVFCANGRYSVLDWGDACVSHPFFSMSVTLEGFLSFGLDDIEGSVDVTPFRDAYLGAFAGLAPPEELEAALAVALRLGWACRMLNVWRLESALPPAPDRNPVEQVRLRLQMLLRESPPT